MAGPSSAAVAAPAVGAFAGKEHPHPKLPGRCSYREDLRFPVSFQSAAW